MADDVLTLPDNAVEADAVDPYALPPEYAGDTDTGSAGLFGLTGVDVEAEGGPEWMPDPYALPPEYAQDAPLTPAEKVSIYAKGAAKEAVPGYVGMRTGIKGAQLGWAACQAPGVALAPMAGVFAYPGIPLACGALGFTAGYMLGSEPTSMVAEQFIEKPEGKEEQILFESGGVFGEILGAGRAAKYIPVNNARGLQLFSRMGETARRNPARFLAAEGYMGFASSMGTQRALEDFPDNPVARFALETGYGFLTPGRFFLTAQSHAQNALMAGQRRFSESARESQFGQWLTQLLNETGEDVDLLLKRLREEDPPGATPTAAGKTGSPTLTVLETTLRQRSSGFGQELDEMSKKTLEAYELLARKMENYASPTDRRLLNRAADTRRSAIFGYLDQRMRKAEMETQNAIDRLNLDADSPEAGRLMRQNVERMLDEARQVETQLWSTAIDSAQGYQKIKGVKPVDQAEVAQYLKQLGLDDAIQYGPTSVIPINSYRVLGDMNISSKAMGMDVMPSQLKQVSNFVGLREGGEGLARYTEGRNSIGRTGAVPDSFFFDEAGDPFIQAVDAQQLINARSNALAQARDARAQGRKTDAGMYNKFADAILEDLSALDSADYDIAREFTKSKNDYFTRTYADELMKTSPTGEYRINDTQIIERAFGMGKDTAYQNAMDIENTMRFMDDQYDYMVRQFGENSEQADLLRPFVFDDQGNRIVRESINSITEAQVEGYQSLINSRNVVVPDPTNPGTYIVNQGALRNFVNKHQKVLDKLGITEDLQNAARAKTAVDTLSKRNNLTEKFLKKNAAFARVLSSSGTSPTEAVASALNSDHPYRDISNLINLAKKANDPAAVDGLKGTIFEYANQQASKSKNFFDGYHKFLFDPVAKDRPSMYSLMLKQGLMTKEEGKNLGYLLKHATRVERAMTNQKVLSEMMSDGTWNQAATDFALRILGTQAAQLVAPKGPGALVAAGAGSKFAREIFDKMPKVMMWQFAQEVVKDPAKMATMIEKAGGANPRGRYVLGSQLYGHVLQSGIELVTPESLLEGPEEEEAPVQPLSRAPSASQMLRNLPTAQTRGLAMAPTAPQQTAAAPAQGPAPTGQGGSREMLQRLFPMDTMLG